MISRFVAAGWLACAACGRIGFDITPDAPAPPTVAPNVIFASSGTFNGALGGVSSADGACAGFAAAAGLPGTFGALIGGEGIDRYAGASGWVLVDGTPIADRIEDLFANGTLAPISLDEHGNELRATADLATWSGRIVGGLEGHDCNGWLDGTSAPVAQVGDVRFAGTSAFAVQQNTCDTPGRLVCIGIDRASHAEVVKLSGRRAFVSSEYWQPAGLASADRLCQADATAAGLSGTYLAALPTATQPTAARFASDNVPWVRPDGALIAATASQLFAGPLLSSAIWLHADATPVVPYGSVWGGDPLSVASLNCNDWTGGASGQVGYIGDPSGSTTQLLFKASSNGCLLDEHLLCLEQ
jgi:hypothetical protein